MLASASGEPSGRHLVGGIDKTCGIRWPCRCSVWISCISWLLEMAVRHRNVAVVGGGNVAMDSARTALRLGAENVYIVYRRSRDEMPARAEEVEHAHEEGVIFQLLTNPAQVVGDENGWVKGLECVQMELGEPDASGRRRPVEKPNSNFVLDVETVVIAIGQGPNPLIQDTTPGMDTNKHGNIVADDDGKTTKDGVFAGGDIVTGAATVILAMGAGKKAAASIHAYVQQKKQG